MHERLAPYQGHGNLLVLLLVVLLSLVGLLAVYAGERTSFKNQEDLGKEVGENGASRKTLLWKGLKRIPRLLHRLELSGSGMLMATAAPHHTEAQRPLLEHFSQACSALHSTWEVRTWDVAALESLLWLRYPQSLDLFYQYPTLFVQGGAVQAFILHALGGVYLDPDVECLNPLDLIIEQHTLILQSDSWAGQALDTGVAASTPEHPFWGQVIGTLLQEAERLKKHPPLTLDSTATVPRGPQLWAATFRELMPALADVPSFHGSHNLANSSVHIYGPDEGFLDCSLAGPECWHQSALFGSTHGHGSQLLGLHHITSLVWRDRPSFPV